MLDVIINAIEAICISCIISLSLKRNKSFIVFQSVCIFLLTSFYNYIHTTELLLLMTITICVMFSYIINKRITLPIFAQIALAILTDSFCNLFALLIVSSISELSLLGLSIDAVFFTFATIISKITFVIITYIIFRHNLRFHEDSLYWTITGLLVTLMVIVYGLTDAIVYRSISSVMISVLSISFVMMVVFLILLIYSYNKEYEEKLALYLKSAQEQVVKNNLQVLESLTYKNSKIEHHINYVLLQIKNDLANGNYAEISRLIEENVWKFGKVTKFLNTNNPVFDSLLYELTAQLLQKGITLSVVSQIDKDVLDRHIMDTTAILDLLTKTGDALESGSQIRVTIMRKANTILADIMALGTCNNVISSEDVICFNKDSIQCAVLTQENTGILRLKCIIKNIES